MPSLNVGYSWGLLAARAIYPRCLLPATSLHATVFAPFAGSEGQSRKRARHDPEVGDPEVVNLIETDDEEEQRQRIMQFAKQTVSQRSHQGEKQPLNVPSAGGEPLRSSSPPQDDTTARNRIMAHASAVNAERGISSNSLLAQLHAERMARRGPSAGSTEPSSSSPGGIAGTSAAGTSNKSLASGLTRSQPGGGNSPPTFSILSYNVWFREDVAIATRMQALVDLIAKIPGGKDPLPDVICLQEVTPFIYNFLSSAPWWRQYTARPEAREVGMASYFTVLLWKTSISTKGGDPKFASLPFGNSIMGRDLKAISLVKGGLSLRVATSHLESPTGWNKLFSEPRKAQCREALKVLESMGGDSMLIGDLNWNEKNDGEPPLPPQW